MQLDTIVELTEICFIVHNMADGNETLSALATLQVKLPVKGHCTPTRRRRSVHLEESIRRYFTTGPSDRCSSESSGTGSPAERPLSEPHISPGVSSVIGVVSWPQQALAASGVLLSALEAQLTNRQRGRQRATEP
jgi:hypothetical protein